MATNDGSVLSGTGVTDPGLAFGLTGVSDWSTEMPFLDLMKTSRPWIGHNGDTWGAMTTDQLASGGYLDADGWPTSIPEGLTSIGTIWAWEAGGSSDPAAASRAGIYVLTYEGKGTLQLGGVSILSSGPGRIVVQNLTGGTMLLNITATDPKHTGDYIHNISLVPLEYEALHDAGEIFNPDWLSVVQDARELRFMDWMNTNGVTHAAWGDRPQVGDVTWAGGVPVEVMVELANQTGTEPWFNMPAGATEAYIRHFATYVRDHLDPALQAHVEYSNEMWNWAFGQTQWLGDQAKTVWGSSDGAAWLDYAAMLATKSALIWDDVFGSDADARVDNVMGTQTANAWIGERLLTAPLWQSMDPSGYVDPSSVFDSLAVTTYFGGATMADATLRAKLLTVLSTPDVDATAWLAAKLMNPDYDQSIPQIEAWWAANKAVADKYGLDLVAYEGGQHVLQSFAVSISDADLATLTTFLSGFVRSQAMAELYHELWTAWAAVSDGPFMQFGDVAAASKFGAWGIFSALGDHNPRADLLMDLNAHTSAWFGDGGGEQYQQGVILVAGDAGETLMGTDKDDFLIGGKGDDTIIAGKGHDAISGGRGHDTLVLSGNPGDYKIVAEGDGYRLTGNHSANFLKNIEIFQFKGDGFSLTLDHMLQLSSTQGQALNGTAGADLLVGTAGDDTITSSKGDDTIIGGNGNDVLVLNSNVGAFTLVVEGDGYRLTGTNTSDFLQGIEGISMDGGPVQLLDSLASPATLHLAVLGDMVDGAHAVKVQVDADPGTGVVIRGIATSSVLGLAMGLDGNSGLADYSVAAAGTHTGLGGATAAQKDGSLQQNQAVSSPSPLAGDPIAAALLVGSIAASVHGIIATGANDRFLGQSQNDVVNGAGGDDYLAGHGGRDILNGNSGRDVILGGNGHDVITGGKGHDVMTGGAGPDEFRFVTGDGYDRITDFSAGDRLNLVGQSIASHDALVAMARENAAGHLTIGDGPDSITLVGLHLSDLGWMDILI